MFSRARALEMTMADSRSFFALFFSFIAKAAVPKPVFPPPEYMIEALPTDACRGLLRIVELPPAAGFMVHSDLVVFPQPLLSTMRSARGVEEGNDP
jgi:hypothetical protein